MSYNGWSNYETWRVNLELIDGLRPGDFTENTGELKDAIKEYCFSYLEDNASGLALDLAMAFLSNVNWDEIVHNLMAEDIAA